MYLRQPASQVVAPRAIAAESPVAAVWVLPAVAQACAQAGAVVPERVVVLARAEGLARVFVQIPPGAGVAASAMPQAALNAAPVSQAALSLRVVAPSVALAPAGTRTGSRSQMSAAAPSGMLPERRAEAAPFASPGVLTPVRPPSAPAHVVRPARAPPPAPPTTRA